MAKDVKDVAEALKLTKIIVAGWSLGGMVAQTVTTESVKPGGGVSSN